jgi:hypothetical protein
LLLCCSLIVAAQWICRWWHHGGKKNVYFTLVSCESNTKPHHGQPYLLSVDTEEEAGRYNYYYDDLLGSTEVVDGGDHHCEQNQADPIFQFDQTRN